MTIQTAGVKHSYRFEYLGHWIIVPLSGRWRAGCV